MRNNDSMVSLGAGGRKSGFRHHSLALGTTVRHFQTINDFPTMPNDRKRGGRDLSPEEVTGAVN